MQNHGFTYLPFKFVAADSKQININVAQKRFSRLAHCATPYIWDDNCLVCATIGLKQDVVHLAIALVCEITSFLQDA